MPCSTWDGASEKAGDAQQVGGWPRAPVIWSQCCYQLLPQLGSSLLPAIIFDRPTNWLFLGKENEGGGEEILFSMPTFLNVILELKRGAVLVASSTAWGSVWQLKKTRFPAAHPAAAVCVLPQPESQLPAGVHTRICRGTLPSAAPSAQETTALV